MRKTPDKKDTGSELTFEESFSFKGNDMIFREMIDTASVGMLLTDLEGIIYFANKKLHQLLRYEPDELIGENIEIIFDKSNHHHFIKPEKILSVKKGHVFRRKIRFLRKDASHFWGVLQLEALHDNKEKTKNIFIQVQDISKFKKSKETFFREYNLLTQLIDNIPANVYIKDSKSRFIFANTWVAGIMGIDNPKKLIGKTDFDFYPESMASKYYDDEQEIISTGNPKINIEEKVMPEDPGKKARWYSTSKIPYRDESGKVIGIMGVGMDITNLKKEQESLRKTKRQAVKADQLKSAFLTNLSHEIRTPLNGILGFSQVMKQMNISSVQVDQYLDIILSNGKQLLNLINDIIDLSKIDAGDIQLSCQSFSLNNLLLQIQKEYNDELKKKSKSHIQLKIIKGANMDESYIYADNFRLRQIYANLLSNAIKFTEKGEITVGYTFTGKEIQCFVSDTGIGISANKHKSVFERFVQVDGSHTRNYAGSGLGLSICEGLVKLMEGNIWLESTPGKGTVFYFAIPHIKVSKGISY